MSSFAALLRRGIRRGISLLPLRLRHTHSSARLLLPSLYRSSFCTAKDPSHPHENVKGSYQHSPLDYPDDRQWKDTEAEILKDIKPITCFIKDILHSNRYMDGEHLTDEDEKAVVEKLLIYHQHAEDKIGCGLDSIMVDRHPEFRYSRCLFIVRTDGGWIDFSYRKCLKAYVREKYPSCAERFIRKHFTYGSPKWLCQTNRVSVQKHLHK